jgi:nicotinamide mononucleotide (NMN) deamidase PncC
MKGAGMKPGRAQDALEGAVDYLKQHSLVVVSAESCTAANGGAKREFADTRIFEGDRNAIREASADYALSRVPHYHQESMR